MAYRYEDSKYCHLVTELCEGGELLDRILDEEHFTEAKAAFYFAEILSALHHCHKKGTLKFLSRKIILFLRNLSSRFET